MSKPDMKPLPMVLLLVLLSGTTGLPAQSTLPPFAPGEKLTYEIEWGIFTVGRAEMELRYSEPFEGVPCWYIHHTARTNDFADVFYPVRNVVESWITPDLSRSLHYKKYEREGKRERDVVIDFDWTSRRVAYANREDRRDPVEVPDGCQDPLSVVFAARLHPWVVGETFTIPVTNGKVAFPTEIKVVKTARIKTGAGHFEAILLEPETKNIGGVFRKSKDAKIQFWFSNDARRLPIVMSSKVAVGSFRAELKKIEQLDPVPVQPALPKVEAPKNREEPLAKAENFP